MPKAASAWLYKQRCPARAVQTRLQTLVESPLTPPDRPWSQPVQQPLAHLVNKAQFDAVFAGKVLSKTVHFALHYAQQVDQALSRCAIGVVLPKRWARRAVTRNTIKRQVYAVSSSCAHSLMQGHYVVRLKTEFSRTTFVSATSDALKRAVRAELQALLEPALSTPDAPNAPNAPSAPSAPTT